MQVRTIGELKAFLATLPDSLDGLPLEADGDGCDFRGDSMTVTGRNVFAELTYNMVYLHTRGWVNTDERALYIYHKEE